MDESCQKEKVLCLQDLKCFSFSLLCVPAQRFPILWKRYSNKTCAISPSRYRMEDEHKHLGYFCPHPWCFLLASGWVGILTTAGFQLQDANTLLKDSARLERARSRHMFDLEGINALSTLGYAIGFVEFLHQINYWFSFSDHFAFNSNNYKQVFFVSVPLHEICCVTLCYVGRSKQRPMGRTVTSTSATWHCMSMQTDRARHDK